MGFWILMALAAVCFLYGLVDDSAVGWLGWVFWIAAMALWIGGS